MWFHMEWTVPYRLTVWRNQSYMYKAKVKSDTDENTYIRVAGNTFKERYTNQKSSLRNRNYFNTALSKHIWHMYGLR